MYKSDFLFEVLSLCLLNSAAGFFLDNLIFDNALAMYCNHMPHII